jgi:hypothetical protein
MDVKIMLVYHGGSASIKEIDIQKCRPYTDFGKDFTEKKINLYRQAN